MKQHLSSWQKESSVKKKAKKKRFFLAFLGLIFFVFVVFLLFSFYRSWGKRAWTRQASFVVAFNLTKENEPARLLLVSFQEGERSISGFLLPENLLLKTVGNKGDYKAGSLFGLDELEGANGQLFKKSLGNNFGLIVDAFVNLPVEDDFFINSLSDINFKNETRAFLLILLKGQGKTDLVNWDILKLLIANFFAKDGRIKVINLTQSQVILTENLADGSKVLRLDIPRTDRLIGEYFTDEVLRQENLDVAVFNASQVSGLAQNQARILSNLGAQVVKIDQYQGEEEVKRNCLLLTSSSAVDSYTAFRLQDAFGCELKNQDTAWARSNLVLIFAGDWF